MQTYNYILLSGGFDSAYGLLRWCVDSSESIQPIFFNYGQKNSEFERGSVEKIYSFLKKLFSECISYPVIINSFSSFDNEDAKLTLFPWSMSEPLTGDKLPDTNFCSLEIENRNMVMISLVFSYILSKLRETKEQNAIVNIYTGFRDDEMPDACSHFFNLLCAALKIYHGEYSFKIHFIEKEFPEQLYKKVARFFKSETKAEEFLDMTTSCYKPKDDGSRCLTCTKCQSFENILKKQAKLRDDGVLLPS